MRIFPICSSSSGNSTFIGTRGHGILIDAGCSFRALRNALDLIDTKIENIEALFITHEHIDHIKALEQIIKHTNLPVFAPPKCTEQLKAAGKIPESAKLYDTYDGYRSASFEVSCFKTSHDSADSVGYKIKYSEETAAVCTDTGFVTESARAALKGVRSVLLESNYDESMLRRNPNYPADLKRRIAGERGHLRNEDCAEFCEALVRGGTRRLILGHLSRENNTPATAESCTRNYLEQRGMKRERDYTLSIAPVMTEGDFIAV